MFPLGICHTDLHISLIWLVSRMRQKNYSRHTSGVSNGVVNWQKTMDDYAEDGVPGAV